MKLNLKNKIIWLVFTFCFVIASFAVTTIFYSREIADKKSKAYRIAEAYAVELKRDFTYATNRNAALEKLVIS